MVVVLLLTSAVLLSVAATNSQASRVVYHGYVLKGSMPTKDQCIKYFRAHNKYSQGAERWRLFVRRATYKQIRYKVAGSKNWTRVWNEDWVIPTIWGESNGLQNPGGNTTFRGLFQIWIAHVAPRYRDDLFVGTFNIKTASWMFARPGPDYGPYPWKGGPPVSASPYCPHK
jgi:hypothetical protein